MGAELIRLGRDFERLWPGIAALAVALLFLGAVVILAHSVDRPPVILKVEVDPPSVPRGTTATIRVSAFDPDGGPLTYEYTAESDPDSKAHGVLRDPAHPEQARYSPAASGSIVDRIFVHVRDNGGRLATASQIVTISGTVASAAPAPEAAAKPDAARASMPAVSAENEGAPPSDVPPDDEAVADVEGAGEGASEGDVDGMGDIEPPEEHSGPNRAPVLNGGGRLVARGTAPLTLEATGMDPDGDQVSFSWDFGPCLDSAGVEVYRAQVTLKTGCRTGIAKLTWTDEQGAVASATWTIHR